MANTYKLTLKDNGYSLGVGRITEFQYLHWSHDIKYNLCKALTKKFDYENANLPENVVFEYDYYHEYDDVALWVGAGEEAWLTIETMNNTDLVVDEELISYLHSQFDDEVNNILDVSYEFIPECDLQRGHYLEWLENHNGVSITGTFEADIYDPSKLRFEGISINDKQYIITNVYYDNVELKYEKTKPNVTNFDMRVLNVE